MTPETYFIRKITQLNARKRIKDTNLSEESLKVLEKLKDFRLSFMHPYYKQGFNTVPSISRK